MKKLWMLLALNCWLMSVQANELGDVRVPVVDRTPEARTAALADGLDRVLVRLTGSRSGPAEPGLAELRRDPSRWVQQFSYEGGSADQELALDVRFDVPVLMRQLEQAGSPVWTT